MFCVLVAAPIVAEVRRVSAGKSDASPQPTRTAVGDDAGWLRTNPPTRPAVWRCQSNRPSVL
jgi:hypothetical protein